MGWAAGEADERNLRTVSLSPFLMSATEISQGQFESLMGYNPSRFRAQADSPRRPVEMLSWLDALMYCNELSIRQGLSPAYYKNAELSVLFNDYVEGFDWHRLPPAQAREYYRRKADDAMMRYDFFIASGGIFIDSSAQGYRLPTEAQWEWAALGTQEDRAAASKAPAGEAGWTRLDSKGRSNPVALKKPNGYGLFDMQGNVWEWCWDGYAAYPRQAQSDPTGPLKFEKYVVRGGSWAFPPDSARPSARMAFGSFSYLSELGFRVTRPAPRAGHGLDAAEKPRDQLLRTPLIAAAEEGQADILKRILKAGGGLNARDARGYDALSAACASNPSVEIVRELLAAGFDPNAQAPAELGYRSRPPSAYLLACKSNPEPAILEVLSASGAKPSEGGDWGLTALSQARANPSKPMIAYLLNRLDADGVKERPAGVLREFVSATPSHEILELLYAKGFKEPDWRGSPGEFHRALFSSNQSSALVAHLLKRGISLRDYGFYKENALMLAAEANPNPEILALLIKAGQNPNERNSAGKSALAYALNGNQPANAITLLKQGGRAASKLEACEGFVFAAMKLSSAELAELCIEWKKAGYDIDEPTANGKTALSDIISSPGLIESLRVLLEAGAKLNSYDGGGRPVFFGAPRANGIDDYLRLFRKHKADFSLREAEGRDFFQYIDAPSNP